MYNDRILGSILPASTKDISAELLLPNGKMKLLPASEYSKYSFEELRHFGHFHARYGYPTEELIMRLKAIIGDRKAIEIGSGHGDLGYHLGIPMTDNKIQNEPHIRQYYELMRQPVIEYPDDVKKFDAIEAVYHYKPKVVVASWVTTYSPKETTYASSPYGIKEEKLLKLVDCYILVGNLAIHGDKPIMKISHKMIAANYILSRATHPENNRIWIWEKK